MEIIVYGNAFVANSDPCCGGAYDYDNDSNCVEDE